jgi:glutamate-1-semialdehyde 2,1-aminomutase
MNSMNEQATPTKTLSDLQRALSDSEARYVNRTPKSAAAMQRASQVMPGGLTRYVLQSSPYPIVINHASASRIHCVDGYEYLDYLGDYSAGLYGHSDPSIETAIKKVLKGGLSYGAPHEHETELASLLVDRFPSVEQVQFANSGTEANLAAIKTARAFTGRDAILVMEGGYHGGVLSFGSGNHRDNAPYDFIIGQFNDWEATLAALGNRQSELAAILIEPALGAGGGILAEPDFLQNLRDLADSNGALLIFDEVATSRHGGGGLQGKLGVTPDLTSMGKYLGGGFAFGCFGGRADVMSIYADESPNATVHNGTFNNHVLTTAVGAAGLREVFTPEVADQFFEHGEAFRQRLKDIVKAQGVKAQITGVGSVIGIHFCPNEVRHLSDLKDVRPEARALLYLELLARGIYMIRRGGAVLSLPLTPDDDEKFFEAFNDVMATYGDVLSV